MVKRLAVIDGKSIFYRGYYAMPNLSTSDGTPTGGVYGFASLSIELIKKLKPDYVAVAWDKAGTNIRKRRAIYPEYKAGRKKAPDDFYAQIPILRELLDAFGWPFYELDDYEADDIMGAFAKQATEKGIGTDLLTSDLDALQLINPLTRVFALKSGLSNLEEFDVDHFEQKYGIKVNQFLDLKSLRGDASDNIPGIAGIGLKTGVQLLQQFGTLDNIYKHLEDIKPTLAQKLKDGHDSAYMSKEISRIWTEAPVQLDWAVADVNDIDFDKVSSILKRLEFSSLIRRLPVNMQKPVTNTKTNDQSQFDLELLTELPIGETINKISNAVVVYTDNDNLYLSADQNSVSEISIKDFNQNISQVLKNNTVICFDGKKLYNQLADAGVLIKFGGLHDIHQAAFLINPLRRDQTLSGLLDAETILTPKTAVSAIWRLYHQQLEAFVSSPKLADIAHNFDFPLDHVLFKMEHYGIKIDSKKLGQMSSLLGDEYNKLEQEIYKIVGYEFNIASPAQLSEVLFTKLQLPTSGIKRGKTGYSTGQKELDKLQGQHPIIELIEKTRELAKLKNTYIDALPKLVDQNGRIHTTFNQDIVSTGRLSSTNPNLQNIPVRTSLGRQIRSAFIPDDGKIFVNADYSQFELRLAAILAEDQNMINDFNNDVDIHTKTASDVYGIPMDKVTKDQRRDAKVINFGVLYGMSSHGLSAATGMSFAAAQKYIDQYFELRKPIRQYLDKTLEQARTLGYVETYFGRRRPTPDVLSGNYMVRSSAERAAANMPIQGTEADLVKRAMIQIDQALAGRGEQILQVHDSILIECPIENATVIAELLKDILEKIAPELKIKLKVDISIGKNWGDL